MKVIITMFAYIELMCSDYKADCGFIGNAELKDENVPGFHESYGFGDAYDHEGEQKWCSRKYIGRLLFFVRGCRVDAMHATISLATEVESWTRASGKKLRRVIAYFYRTRHWGPMWAFSSGNISDPWLYSQSDVDWGTCILSRKSKSGWLLWLKNERGQAPIDWGCRRQSSVAGSTCESELLAVRIRGREHCSRWPE